MTAIDPDRILKSVNTIERQINATLDHALAGEAMALACSHYIAALPGAASVDVEAVIARMHKESRLYRTNAEAYRRATEAIRRIHLRSQKASESPKGA